MKQTHIILFSFLILLSTSGLAKQPKRINRFDNYNFKQNVINFGTDVTYDYDGAIAPGIRFGYNYYTTNYMYWGVDYRMILGTIVNQSAEAMLMFRLPLNVYTGFKLGGSINEDRSFYYMGFKAHFSVLRSKKVELGPVFDFDVAESGNRFTGGLRFGVKF